MILKNKKAMSLIEVVITITILSFISIFIFNSTETAYRVRSKASNENEFYHLIRNTIRHLDRDISQAFHSYNDTSLGQYYRLRQENVRSYVPQSIFKGDEENLVFTSTSHRRMYKDTKETDLCEISYFIETDPKNPNYRSIFKRETFLIDEDLEEGGNEFVLTANVDELKFRYLSSEGISNSGTWVDSWDSTEGKNKYKFPNAVEYTIVFNNPSNEKKIKITQIVKILRTNNLSRTNVVKSELQGEISN
jgi:general secretion pathway protein J